MSGEVPRLRMFAGPNGSGKSTLKSVLQSDLIGVYLNPDEIEREIKTTGRLPLSGFQVELTSGEVQTFFRESTLLAEAGLAALANEVSVEEGHLLLTSEATNSYVASVLSDLFRQRLLAAKVSFTIEPVMSHRSKVALLKRAQELGYRSYLYFIATEDPLINISRVKTRVQLGGHPVPEDRIVKRYQASLGLLMDAIRCTNRAYIFDNSTENRDRTWIAEITEGRDVVIRSNEMPAWFRHAVWDKVSGNTP